MNLNNFRNQVVNVLLSGGIGGCEVLCKHIYEQSRAMHLFTCRFVFLHGRGVITEELCAEGAEVVSLEQFAKLSFGKLRKLLRAITPEDIVVFHDANPVSAPYLLALKCLRPYQPCILVLHNCFEESRYFRDTYGTFKKKLWQRWLRAELKAADRLVFVSHAGMRSFFNSFPLDVEKSVVIYNGISPTQLGSDRLMMTPHPHEGGRLVALYIGRLSVHKNVFSFIEAVALLKGRCEVEAYIVGDGEEMPRLKALAKARGIEQNVHFEGFRRDLEQYYLAADCFVYPSSWEVFGLSIVEAMAYGLPCIVNRVGGIPELVEDRGNGLITREISTEALSEALLEMANMPMEKRKEMIGMAISTARKFSVENNVRQYKALFDTL